MRSIAVDKANDCLLILVSPVVAMVCLIAYLLIAAAPILPRNGSARDA